MNQQLQTTQENKKVIAGLCGILLGSFGVHRFILGDTKGGLIRLGLTIITCGMAGIIGFVEGIIYITKSDEEFMQTYQIGGKAWF
jgi:TM2 domain-containing membrane protein YozV